jgi:hypothetical protein
MLGNTDWAMASFILLVLLFFIKKNELIFLVYQSRMMKGIVVPLHPSAPKPVFTGIYAGEPATLQPVDKPDVDKVKANATKFATGVFGGANLPGMKGRGK